MPLPAPLSDPLPIEPIERVKRFARDLAWGALNGLWEPRLGVTFYSPFFAKYINLTSVWDERLFKDYFTGVWGPVEIFEENYITATEIPSFWMLEVLNYVVSYEAGVWKLTEKAFALLEEQRPESIFISYRRAVSSALAMLIAAELRLVGFQPFIDIQDIPLGDKWHALVEKRVRDSNIFIIVIGPATLDSTTVQKEIEWALENEQNRRIIPILHSGFTEAELEAAYPALQQNNLIRIQSDRATDFYAALQLLKNALGV